MKVYVTFGYWDCDEQPTVVGVYSSRERAEAMNPEGSKVGGELFGRPWTDKFFVDIVEFELDAPPTRRFEADDADD